jgi:hypothetical protein
MDTFKLKDKEIDKVINDSISSIGFKKSKKGIYAKSVSDNVEILLIIEKTDRRTGNTFYLNPIVAIIDKHVEILYHELVTDIDTSKEIVNTAIVSLGYLTPENKYLTWTIPVTYSEAQTKEVVVNLVSTFRNYAMPYLETLKERNELLISLQTSKLGLQKINHYKIPILYYLLGAKDKGLEYVRNILQNERPTPKKPEIPEPEFSTYKEALDYFRQDKDVRFYYGYRSFEIKYENL